MGIYPITLGKPRAEHNTPQVMRNNPGYFKPRKNTKAEKYIPSLKRALKRELLGNL